ncbi:hypothetical protein Vadar_032285 [Vaccinium darrowii]|uniref:Uncharacterized protein n=1 Tax=Vaccinium darrowii TaxID=229202 RepID=A0ACB7Y3K7_9ERIC|nr:hypothetical protein Vadar_032285 [Vaccinium darrowii]
MKNLIALVNKLHRACTALGNHGEESALVTLWDALLPSPSSVARSDLTIITPHLSLITVVLDVVLGHDDAFFRRAQLKPLLAIHGREENIEIEEVFVNLRCGREGLTAEDVEQRLTIFGYNILEEKEQSKILKFLSFMWNPFSLVMEAAAIMAIALANGGGKPPAWQDFIGIIILLLINSTISFAEENNAGNAVAALMARLAPKAKVLRDGKWSEKDAAVLVPDDIISIKLGDIIPSDARLLDGDPLKVDQSALTGESLPVTKGPGEGVYSGSTCKQGEIEAVVMAIGVHTFFGKAVVSWVHVKLDTLDSSSYPCPSVECPTCALHTLSPYIQAPLISDEDREERARARAVAIHFSG